MKWLAALLATAHPAPATTCLHNCTISPAGYELTETYEGFMPFIYKDVAGQDTIGFGHLIRSGEHFDQPLIPEQAHNVLVTDESIAAVAVNKQVNIPLKQPQFDALCDFTFNLGAGTLQKSTLLKHVNSGLEVQSQFLRYVNAGGKPVAGLLRRRKAEANLYGMG